MQGEQKGRTPLCAASDAGKLKAVKRLLLAEAKVDWVDFGSRGRLHTIDVEDAAI